jgi:phenylalanyl-tRNA synthetase beta chain
MFEMNQVYRRTDGVDEQNVPNGRHQLASLFVDDSSESNYYAAKHYLEALLDYLGIDFEIREFAVEKDQSNAYYEPKRSAAIYAGDVLLGYLGELKLKVLREFKLPQGTAGFELDLNKMLELAGTKAAKLIRFSQFQSVERDLTLTVPETQSYAEIERALRKIFDESGYIYKIRPVSIFQAEGQKTKNVSFRFEFSDFNKTLTKQAIQDIMKKLEAVKF